MGMKTIMDKKQTMAYIKNLTGEDTEIVMECLLADKNDFFLKTIEDVLQNRDVYRYVWNNLYLPFEMIESRIVDYDAFSNYPKFREFLEKRFEAYLKIDDGEYVHKEFSSERLKYIPFFNMTDNQLSEKLDYNDWKSFYIDDDVITYNIYDKQHDKLNNFCIIEKDTENRVGILAIDTNKPTVRDWNIAYMIAKEYRGRGYAQESVNAMIEAVKNKHIFGIKNTLFKDVYKKITNCKNIVGVVRSENVDSQRVLERCGFYNTTKFERDGFVTYILNVI